jgi:diguanylate cyclase (GGDEF)-like protein
MIDAAAFLKSSVRALDIVCRNGTSGFGLILPGTGESCANAVARLEKRISQWLMTRVASNSPLRVSFGYATAPDHGRSVADLLKLAQQDASQSTENRPAA